MGSAGAGRLDFAMLGPLEVRRDGEPVRLGGGRQRSLLALLLVHANQVLSVDRLVDELFDSPGRENAANAVRVAVSRLRGLLANGGHGNVLQTLWIRLHAALGDRALSDAIAAGSALSTDDAIRWIEHR